MDGAYIGEGGRGVKETVSVVDLDYRKLCRTTLYNTKCVLFLPATVIPSRRLSSRYALAELRPETLFFGRGGGVRG